MAKRFYYGGQAVIEGVMMRGQKTMVTAVRRPDGGLAIDTQPLAAIYTGWMRKTPLIRGIIVLIEAWFWVLRLCSTRLMYLWRRKRRRFRGTGLGYGSCFPGLCCCPVLYRSPFPHQVA